MTEEQKRFKITKRESYEKQISEENKTPTIITFLVGVSSAAIINLFSLAKDVDLSAKLVTICESLALSITGISAYNLKGLINAISKKTMLEGKVEDINTELEMSENNESRGMKR